MFAFPPSRSGPAAATAASRKGFLPIAFVACLAGASLPGAAGPAMAEASPAQAPAAAAPAPDPAPAPAAAPAAGDPVAGEQVFLKCRACHQVGPGAKHTTGPSLNGVIGRKAGTAEGYNFSSAMKNSGLTWDRETLRVYLKNPRAKVTGTRMIFLGLPKDKDIDNLLAYLGQFNAAGEKAQ